MEILRLTLSNGVEGIACCDTASDAPASGDVVRSLRSLGERVIGKSVGDRVGITESLLAHADEGPWEGVSLLDGAMWDAYARSENLPLWKLLGARQSEISAYASTAAHLAIDDYVDDIARCAKLGFRAVKLHLNTDPAFDLELVRAVAEQYRDSGLRFMADLEECYAFDDAVRLGRVLDGLPFDWLEAPLPDTELAAYAELNRSVSIDVLPAGNTIVGVERWRGGLETGAWSRLRCDVTNGGGITTVMKGMALARDLGVATELQSFGFQPTQYANLHLMLGAGGCSYFEQPAPSAPYEYAARQPLAVNPLGRVAANAAAGLGIDMDWDTIAGDAFECFDSAG